MSSIPKQNQQQIQREVQIQKLSPQQFLLTKLIELPLPDFEQRVRDEIYENVALEEGRESTDGIDNFDDTEEDGAPEVDESIDTLDILNTYDEDDLPTYTANRTRESDAEIPIGDTRSFIEDLQAQIADYDVDEHQRVLITYLIGSLDDRGFVDRPLRNIVDDLLFNHNIDVDEKTLEEALHILQRFDPVGIGARNLQECLLLQIDRQLEEKQETLDGQLSLLQLERRIIAEEFDLFKRNEIEKITTELEVSPERVHQAIEAIGRLNPHPGRSLHEAADDRVQTIIPDFIVETDHESSISFVLNNGEVPPLRMSRDYVEQLRSYKGDVSKMSRSQRDAFIYTKQKVEAAQMFISAIHQRQQTLTATMQAIIDAQRDFMLTQDEFRLRPLRLADVALRTGQNISTVSRVANSKYALVDGVLYPLKFFFLRTKTNAEGKAIMRTKVHPLLREIIEEEDKRNPLSDEQISAMMTQRGEAISRRTVAKYRDELGIPTASLRRRLQ